MQVIYCNYSTPSMIHTSYMGSINSTLNTIFWTILKRVEYDNPIKIHNSFPLEIHRQAEYYSACRWISRGNVEIKWSCSSAQLGIGQLLPTGKELSLINFLKKYFVNIFYTKHIVIACFMKKCRDILKITSFKFPKFDLWSKIGILKRLQIKCNFCWLTNKILGTTNMREFLSLSETGKKLPSERSKVCGIYFHNSIWQLYDTWKALETEVTWAGENIKSI